MLMIMMLRANVLKFGRKRERERERERNREREREKDREINERATRGLEFL